MEALKTIFKLLIKLMLIMIWGVLQIAEAILHQMVELFHSFINNKH